jgi:NadR type nicotinamide-nucleotide adenylyltransferase
MENEKFKMIKKIVIIGPESTGKSTLSGQLAAHYGSLSVKEYAREYLLKNGTDYTYDSLLNIAKGQIGREENAIKTIQKSGNLNFSTSQPAKLFIDTDMYVMKVWCEFVFGQCHQWILDQIAERKYDLYLLCNIDLPWIKDELREYPELATREKLYNHYKDCMQNQSVPWVNISGSYEVRLQKAKEAVEKFT